MWWQHDDENQGQQCAQPPPAIGKGDAHALTSATRALMKEPPFSTLACNHSRTRLWQAAAHFLRRVFRGILLLFLTVLF